MSDCTPKFFDPTGEIRKSGGGLPHWEQKGVCYFITFRLADSLPVTRLKKWKEERAGWLTKHPKPWDEETEGEYHRVFSMKIERWLDQGIGACLLRDPKVRDVILEKMLERHGVGYFVHRLVLMPNHAHVLVSLEEGTLGELMKRWKGGTAFWVNKALGRSGVFWQRDYFDRIVRDARHYQRCVRYIEGNPGKAGLGEGETSVWVAD